MLSKSVIITMHYPYTLLFPSCLDSIPVLFSMCMSYYSLQVTIMLHDMIQFRY